MRTMILAEPQGHFVVFAQFTGTGCLARFPVSNRPGLHSMGSESLD